MKRARGDLTSPRKSVSFLGENSSLALAQIETAALASQGLPQNAPTRMCRWIHRLGPRVFQEIVAFYLSLPGYWERAERPCFDKDTAVTKP